MSPEQKYEILQDPEVKAIRMQMQDAGAPFIQLTQQAMDEATKNMNPGTAIAARLVADCLLQKFKDWQEQRQPKNFFQKVIKWFATGKWG